MNTIKTILQNLKTAIPGILSFLLSIPIFVSAIQSWAQGQPVNWKLVLVGVICALNGAGNIFSKANTTHSTVSEVEASTTKTAVAASKP
jgi:hypothetical protein